MAVVVVMRHHSKRNIPTSKVCETQNALKSYIVTGAFVASDHYIFVFAHCFSPPGQTLKSLLRLIGQLQWLEKTLTKHSKWCKLSKKRCNILFFVSLCIGMLIVQRIPEILEGIVPLTIQA